MSLQTASEHYLMALIDDDTFGLYDPVRLAPCRAEGAKKELINLMTQQGYTQEQIDAKLKSIENKAWEDSIDAE